MSGLVTPGDLGKTNREMIVQYALGEVEGLLKDGFKGAFLAAKRQVDSLNKIVLEAQRVRDPKFKDIFATSALNFYTGPFEVAVISGTYGVSIYILGVDVDINDVYGDGRINKNLIPNDRKERAFPDFQRLLERNKLPVGNERGQLKLRWGKQPSSTYGIGGIGIKSVPGSFDITKEVEDFIRKLP